MLRFTVTVYVMKNNKILFQDCIGYYYKLLPQKLHSCTHTPIHKHECIITKYVIVNLFI